jgi:type III pantothenate kinase
MKKTETLLALDVGNTNVVLGIFVNEKLTITRRLSTDSSRTPDEAGMMVKMLCQDGGVDPKDIDAVAIASVAPRAGNVYRRMAKDHLNKTPLFIHGRIPGFVNFCKPARALGADRVCDAVAGYAKYGGPLLVLDFGTAITFDVVGKEGEYLGGAIMPGLEKSSSILKSSTALLPEVRLEMPDKVIATTTDESIRVGLMMGTVHCLRGLIGDYRKVLNAPDMKVISTGGLAKIICPYIPEVTVIEPDLVLDGIYLIHQWSKKW